MMTLDSRLALLMVTLSSCALVHAQSVLLLESFEDSVDAVEVVGGNARTVDDITISQHTKMGADDIRVTDGEKSFKLELGASSVESRYDLHLLRGE